MLGSLGMKKGRGGENRIGKGAGKRRRKQIAGIAGTWEQGARSREQGAASREQEAGSTVQEEGRWEQGVGSTEQGEGSREQGEGAET